MTGAPFGVPGRGARTHPLLLPAGIALVAFAAAISMNNQSISWMTAGLLAGLSTSGAP